MTGINCAACHVGEITHHGLTCRIIGAPNLFSPEAYYRGLVDAGLAMVKDPPRFLRFVARVRQNSGQANPLLDADTASRSRAFLDAVPRIGERVGAADAEGVFLQGLVAKLKLEASKPSKQTVDLLLRREPIAGSSRLSQSIFGGVTADSPPSFLLGLSRQPRGPLAAVVQRASERQAIRLAFAQDAITTFRLLKARLQLLLRFANNGKGTPGGFGRVDAFGVARNTVFPTFANQNPTTAPIGYPHLWGLSSLTWLHWDANTNSLMERNMGQAIGVGAVFVPDAGRPPVSTLRVREIFHLEQLARRVPGPKWPADILGPIDTAAAQRGEITYRRDCAVCHDGAAAERGERLFRPDEIGTDPKRAENFARPVGASKFSDAIFAFLKGIKTQAYADARLTPAEQALFDGDLRPIAWRQTRSYPARTLTGIWATSPYLHNNSVPTLSDLLSDDRPPTFWVGSREYDPERIGLITDKDPTRAFQFDTTLPGNSNAGHNGRRIIDGREYRFGTDYSPMEKRDLLVYLKQL